MKKMKWFLFLLLSITVILAACSNSKESGKTDDVDSGEKEKNEPVSAEVISLNFWNGFTGPDGEDMKKIVDQFNQEFAGEINVKTETMQWGVFYDKIRTVVTQGQAPDVAIMHLDQMPGMARNGILYELDELAKDLDMTEEEFIPAVWNAGVYEDKRYAIPLDVHPIALYYNVDLLNEAGYDAPPTTWDEFLEMSQAMTKDDQYGFAMPVLWPSQLIYFSALYQHGGESVSPDGLEPLYNSEAGIEALQKLTDLVHKYKVSPTDIQQDGEVTLFRQGKVGFHMNGIWMINGFVEQDGLNFATAPIPTMGDTKAAWAGSHNFVLPKQKKDDPAKQQAAMKFIKYVADNSLEWAKAGQIPAKNSVNQSAEFLALEHQANIAKQSPYLVFAPASPTYVEAWVPAEEGVQLAILGQKTPEAALNDAADRGRKEAAAAQ
ncbi:MAG: ABC transporter substrate-binding protein [Anaerobacillus sp.]|uniref:ABC transporter substrate-binding protein n=1 Tax=Anaerobacillus sp. TaxID=1872506 RepID=UPI00391B6F77